MRRRGRPALHRGRAARHSDVAITAALCERRAESEVYSGPVPLELGEVFLDPLSQVDVPET